MATTTSSWGSRKVKSTELSDIARAFVRIAPGFIKSARENKTYKRQGKTNLVELAACDMLARYETVNGGVDFNAANTLYSIALAACLSASKPS
jgi:hypothetical protein